MTRLVTFSLVLFTSAIPARADEESQPHAYVKGSQDGRYYFRMVPDPSGDRDKGRVTGYEVKGDGPDATLWTLDGLYAFEASLSYDGRYLAALGNWPRGHKPHESHTAIAFYDRGKLLKRYSTKDLIKDAAQVQPSVSHYQYKKRVPGFPAYAYVFELVTIDGISYTFDVRDGRIVSQRKVDP